MNTSKTYNAILEKWLDFQKNMFNIWQENFIPKMNKDDQTEKNTFSDYTKKHLDLFLQWSDINNDLFANTIKTFGEMNFPQNFTNNMTNSLHVYHELYRFWQDLIEQFKENDPKKIENFYLKWKEEYMKFVSDHFLSYLPQSLQYLYEEPIKTSQMYFNISKKFFDPWFKDANQFQTLLTQSFWGDKDAFIQYANLWQEDYEKTFGKLLHIPMVGINKEYFEKQMESFDSFIKYIGAMNAFAATMYKVGSDTMQKIIKDYYTILQEGKQPITFKDFYQYWSDTNEEAYKKLFITDEFAKLSSQVIDASLNFKKDCDKLLEYQFKFLPLPTQTDMDSLYKTVYELKKEIKSLKKLINAHDHKELLNNTKK
jgi:class III poly(R)-hydroxyalkanoic acid synthase PhaE subunit